MIVSLLQCTEGTKIDHSVCKPRSISYLAEVTKHLLKVSSRESDSGRLSLELYTLFSL